MRKGKDLSHDLDRLVAATIMFARQQSERATFGDDEDFDDAKQETQTVIAQVLDTVEKNLDEDILEHLDRGDYPRMASSTLGCWPRLSYWRTTWPYGTYNMYRGRASVRPVDRETGRTQSMLDQILDDFRADLESRLKNARREDRSLSDAELDEALQELKKDLSIVARRSRRREDRREEEASDSRRATHSAAARKPTT